MNQTNILNFKSKSLSSERDMTCLRHVSSERDIAWQRQLKHYIFGNQFCSKSARKLRFVAFLHFHAKNDIILSELEFERYKAEDKETT